jgi:hypothetical protein
MPDKKDQIEKLECEACHLPHGYVEEKALVIKSSHKSKIHILYLTPARLRELADEIEQRQMDRAS